MFIFSLVLTADKICICNLAGKPEIWVSPNIMTRRKDRVLRYLRHKLEDESITALIQQRGEYMVIRNQNRVIYMDKHFDFPDEIILLDDEILFDDKDFVTHIIHNGDCNVEQLYYKLSDRLKRDTDILFPFIEYRISRRFPIISAYVNKEIIIKLMKQCDYSALRRSQIYKHLPDKFICDIDIIKTTLLDSEIYEDVTNRFFNSAPSYIFEYDFIIANFSNACIIPIYIGLNYDDYINNKIDTYGKLNMLKLSIKYCDNSHYKLILYEATNNYIHYLYKNPEIGSDNTTLKQLIDIVDSDIFDVCRNRLI